MAKTAQEKKAELAKEAENRMRLLSFDCGIESCIATNGLEKTAVAKHAGAKDFKEFAEWTLNVASAAAEQQAEAKK
jgi:hypothetical protein